MWITRPAAAALLVMMTGLPAMAQDIEIATLGRAPIMGSSRDSAELQAQLREPGQSGHPGAGRPQARPHARSSTSNFKEQVAIGNASWVPIPRHLDKMTWAADGTVHVLQGVHIPAGQMGYRVEVPKQNGTGTYIVYLPAKCGNLSYVFEQQKRVASVAVVPAAAPARRRRAELPGAADARSSPRPACPAPPRPSRRCAIVPAVAHHFSLLPLAALLPFLINGGSSGCTGSDCTTPSVGTI